jgi:UBA/TS-N domain
MSSSLPSSDPKAVTTLTAMGFPESKAIVALLRADNDVNRAVELLSTGSKFEILFRQLKHKQYLNLNLAYG